MFYVYGAIERKVYDHFAPSEYDNIGNVELCTTKQTNVEYFKRSIGFNLIPVVEINSTVYYRYKH